MFARLHRRGKVQRTKSGRRGENHQIQLGLQQITIRVEADELLIAGHVDLVFVLTFQTAQTGLQAILEHVAHGHQTDRTGHAQRVTDNRRAALAAAEQPDTNLVAAADVHVVRQR